MFPGRSWDGPGTGPGTSRDYPRTVHGLSGDGSGTIWRQSRDRPVIIPERSRDCSLAFQELSRDGPGIIRRQSRDRADMIPSGPGIAAGRSQDGPGIVPRLSRDCRGGVQELFRAILGRSADRNRPEAIPGRSRDCSAMFPVRSQDGPGTVRDRLGVPGTIQGSSQVDPETVQGRAAGRTETVPKMPPAGPVPSRHDFGPSGDWPGTVW